MLQLSPFYLPFYPHVISFTRPPTRFHVFFFSCLLIGANRQFNKRQAERGGEAWGRGYQWCGFDNPIIKVVFDMAKSVGGEYSKAML